MSRFSLDPPDEDRYSDTPIDVQDEPTDSDPLTPIQRDAVDAFFDLRVGPITPSALGEPGLPVDPIEHIAQAALMAVHALEIEVIATAWNDLDRANLVKNITRQLFAVMDRIDSKASSKIDAILERRR